MKVAREPVSTFPCGRTVQKKGDVVQPQYLADEKGFYDRHTYIEYGQKWRPIDFEQGQMVYDNPYLARRREQTRELQNRHFPTQRYI